MNIFISWSGETSMKIANELKEFIPKIIQSAKPYYTASDIEKGDRWESEINLKLQESLVGLICLTPENTERPWIHFESGALSNRLEKSKVCPILFGLKKGDVTGPLARFQMTDFNKVDFYKLAQSINSSMDELKIEEKLLRESFKAFFPQFEKKVNAIIKNSNKEFSPQENLDNNIPKKALNEERADNTEILRKHKDEVQDLRSLYKSELAINITKIDKLEKLLSEKEKEITNILKEKTEQETKLTQEISNIQSNDGHVFAIWQDEKQKLLDDIEAIKNERDSFHEAENKAFGALVELRDKYEELENKYNSNNKN